METPIQPWLIFLLLFVSALAVSSSSLSDHDLGHPQRSRGGRRMLLGFKETPHGNNVSFDCSPSGPCVPCLYSEKNDEKYRCSETGYRIPFKCIEIEAGSKVSKGGKSQKGRSALEVSPHNEEPPVMLLHDAEQLVASVRQRILLDDSSNPKSGSQAYITYRSCIPAANEERLSVLGFEGIVVFMLIVSGSVVYLKRKNAAATGAPMRIPTSSRF